MLWLVALLSCTKTPADTADAVQPATCAELMAEPGDASSEAGLQGALEAVRWNLFPELREVSLTLQANSDDSSFFAANLVIATIDDPPLEREYVVIYSTLLLPDPPPYGAVVAILAHELKHVSDYTELDGEALAEFGLWYATADDISEYERATDEHALALGCGEGLIQYREWLYAHIDPSEVEAKEYNYYTPEEIAAWMAANP